MRLSCIVLFPSLHFKKIYDINNLLPLWRNWQTHMTQNHAGNHAGSSPASGIFYKNFKSIFKTSDRFLWSEVFEIKLE